MSLNKIYNQNKDAGLKKSISYSVPVKELHIEPGFNIRKTDAGHISNLMDALTNGKPVPALRVKDADGRIIVVDGHHTLRAAIAAGIPELPCVDVSGLTYREQIALMITSTQGRKLSPLEKGEGFLRMRNDGMHPKEIAAEVGCSLSTVDLHLLLMTGDDKIKEMVSQGQINFADAVELIRKNGNQAGEMANAVIEQTGGKKVRTQSVLPKFPAKKARRLTELATQIELVGAQNLDEADEEQSMTLRCPAGVVREIMALINDYSEVSNG